MKKWIWISVSALLLLGIFLPTLISIPPIKYLWIKKLEKQHAATIEIKRAKFSWTGPQELKNIAFKTAELTASAEEITSPVPFWKIQSFDHSFVLKNGSAIVGASGSIEQVQAQKEGAQIEASGVTRIGNQTGGFLIQGKAESSTSGNFTASFTQMPSLAIDSLLNAKGIIAAALGSTFNLKASGFIQKESGQFDFDLSSLNATGSASGAFTASEITLRSPLLATCQLTEDLGKLLFPKFPLIGQDRISLRVPEQNFILPRLFSLNALQVQNATLNLGRVHMQNSKQLAPLFSLLKANKSSEQTDVWFAPVDFTIKNGELTLARLDALLANSRHLCAWGKIKLVKRRLDMILGIPADTLQSAFGIQNLPDSYVLKVPVTGSIDNPKFDTSGVTAKIATMTAAQTLPKVGGKAGAIMGGLLSIAGAAADNGDAPPPKRPFPWE